MQKTLNPTGPLNFTLLLLTLVLVGAGLIMVFSSSTIIAANRFGDAYFFVKRQLLWASLGLLGLWFFSKYPYLELKRWIMPGLVVCVTLLIAVLLLSFGKSIGGARRWLSLGPISFQPAEMLKVVMVLYLAEVLERRHKKLTTFMQGVFPQLMVLAGVSGLLLLQPDLGTVVILVLVGLAMIYVAGGRFSHLVGIGLAALPIIFVLIYKVGYRRRRWAAFLDPWQDPLGRGFQMIQSFLALGSGGLWGRGLCESQQKLFYLPAPHTDFIFSIIGEELGFIGTFSLVLLFGFFVWKGFQIARQCQEPFGKLLALGLTLLLGIQAIVNMGVTMGLMPTKGTPLPFISMGGSSLFFCLAAVGMLLSISRTNAEEGAGNA